MTALALALAFVIVLWIGWDMSQDDDGPDGW
jgi:hypothetical protein